MVMNKMHILNYCSDGTCCCLPLRNTVICISIITMSGYLLDTYINNKHQYNTTTNELVESFKQLITKVFQIANFILLLIIIIEDPIPLQLYLCYAMGFVIMGLVVTLLEFLHKFQNEGFISFSSFATDILFLFVIYACLPVVDAYRKHLNTMHK